MSILQEWNKKDACCLWRDQIRYIITNERTNERNERTNERTNEPTNQPTNHNQPTTTNQQKYLIKSKHCRPKRNQKKSKQLCEIKTVMCLYKISEPNTVTPRHQLSFLWNSDCSFSILCNVFNFYLYF